MNENARLVGGISLAPAPTVFTCYVVNLCPYASASDGAVIPAAIAIASSRRHIEGPLFQCSRSQWSVYRKSNWRQRKTQLKKPTCNRQVPKTTPRESSISRKQVVTRPGNKELLRWIRRNFLPWNTIWAPCTVSLTVILLALKYCA